MRRRGHGSAGVPPACKKKIAGVSPARLLSLVLNLRAFRPQISLFTRRRGRLRFHVHAMSVILCLLCFTFPAFARGDVSFVGRDDIGLDLSFQFLGAIRTQDALGTGVIGIGGRAGYYLGSIVFIDAGFLHEPVSFQGFAQSRTVVLGGFRFGTIFDDWIGVFAKTRVGALQRDLKRMEWPPETGTGTVTRAPRRPKYVSERKETYPVIDVGIIVEHHWERNVFVRMDIGTWIIPFGDKVAYSSSHNDYRRAGTKSNFAMEFGFGFRF